MKFPIKITQPKFQIDCMIDEIEVKESSIRLYISIIRTGMNSLPWYDDKKDHEALYLQQADGQKFAVIPASIGGVFAKNSELGPGQTYKGWLGFHKPTDKKFTFHYPDMEPVEIVLD